jgi:hypothetical protein
MSLFRICHSAPVDGPVVILSFAVMVPAQSSIDTADGMVGVSSRLHPLRLAGWGADPRSMSEIAFHEKAGRSQVGSFVFSLDKVFLRPS